MTELELFDFIWLYMCTGNIRSKLCLINFQKNTNVSAKIFPKFSKVLTKKHKWPSYNRTTNSATQLHIPKFHDHATIKMTQCNFHIPSNDNKHGNIIPELVTNSSTPSIIENISKYASIPSSHPAYMSKCPWANHLAPNCSQWLCYQCVNVHQCMNEVWRGECDQ